MKIAWKNANNIYSTKQFKYHSHFSIHHFGAKNFPIESAKIYTDEKKISKTPENMRFELEIKQCWTCGVRIEFVMQSAFCSLWLSITCLLVVQHQCFHISMNSSIKISFGLLSQVFKFWIENYIVSNVIINSYWNKGERGRKKELNRTRKSEI